MRRCIRQLRDGCTDMQQPVEGLKWTVLRGFEYMGGDCLRLSKTALKWAIFCISEVVLTRGKRRIEGVLETAKFG